MDLSFGRLERGVAVAAFGGGMAVLLAQTAARQAASVTARLHATLAAQAVRGLPATRRGAFDPATARAFIRWQAM